MLRSFLSHKTEGQAMAQVVMAALLLILMLYLGQALVSGQFTKWIETMTMQSNCIHNCLR